MDVAGFVEPSLKNVIDQKSLRWIFVGGKGGSGKTTCSCSLAVQLSKVRESVLIMTTDPGQNCKLSDAFNQKFSNVPTKVNGFDNLFARVMDPIFDLNELIEEGPTLGLREKVIQRYLRSLPGPQKVDIYGEVTKVAMLMSTNYSHYSAVVFDTAPGQTPRLLAFLQALELEYAELEPLINQMVSRIGGFKAEFYRKDVGEMLSVFRQVNSQFKDPNRTTFVCVCNPDYLSLSETENLMRDLSRCGIDIRNIVVNKMLKRTAAPCPLYSARLKEQNIYLAAIEDLHNYFHITKLPLLDNEVRGAAAVCSFSEHLVKPYLPPASNA